MHGGKAEMAQRVHALTAPRGTETKWKGKAGATDQKSFSS